MESAASEGCDMVAMMTSTLFAQHWSVLEAVSVASTVHTRSPGKSEVGKKY